MDWYSITTVRCVHEQQICSFCCSFNTGPATGDRYVTLQHRPAAADIRRAVILGGPRRAPHSSPQGRREITATIPHRHITTQLFRHHPGTRVPHTHVRSASGATLRNPKVTKECQDTVMHPSIDASGILPWNGSRLLRSIWSVQLCSYAFVTFI